MILELGGKTMDNIMSDLNHEYNKLLESELETFQLTVKEMIKTGFIVRGIESRYDKFFEFIFKYQNLFYLFFKIIGFEFYERRDKQVFYIKDQDDSFVSYINKNDAIILLALRSLYEEQKETVTMHDLISIKYSHLNQKLVDINFEHVTKERAQVTYVRNSLRLFRDHNIIRFDSKLEDDSYINIYPSIELILDFNEMEEIINRIRSLITGEVTNETRED